MTGWGSEVEWRPLPVRSSRCAEPLSSLCSARVRGRDSGTVDDLDPRPLDAWCFRWVTCIRSSSWPADISPRREPSARAMMMTISWRRRRRRPRWSRFGRPAAWPWLRDGVWLYPTTLGTTEAPRDAWTFSRPTWRPSRLLWFSARFEIAKPVVNVGDRIRRLHDCLTDGRAVPTDFRPKNDEEKAPGIDHAPHPRWRLSLSSTRPAPLLESPRRDCGVAKADCVQPAGQLKWPDPTHDRWSDKDSAIRDSRLGQHHLASAGAHGRDPRPLLVAKPERRGDCACATRRWLIQKGRVRCRRELHTATPDGSIGVPWNERLTGPNK